MRARQRRNVTFVFGSFCFRDIFLPFASPFVRQFFFLFKSLTRVDTSTFLPCASQATKITKKRNEINKTKARRVLRAFHQKIITSTKYDQRQIDSIAYKTPIPVIYFNLYFVLLKFYLNYLKNNLKRRNFNYYEFLLVNFVRLLSSNNGAKTKLELILTLLTSFFS